MQSGEKLADFAGLKKLLRLATVAGKGRKKQVNRQTPLSGEEALESFARRGATCCPGKWP
jgi:hypothetical protein